MCLKKCKNVTTLGKLESNPEKAGVSCCGLIAFGFTLTFALIYFDKWMTAREMGDEYYCTDYRLVWANENDAFFEPENVGKEWMNAFLHNWILYAILSVFNLCAIIGGWKVNLRNWACCGHVLASGYYLFAVILASVARFSDAGVYCALAPYPGGVFTEHGSFLKKMVTAQWILICPLTCLATSGMKEISREKSDPRHRKTALNELPTEDEPSKLDERVAGSGHKEDHEDSEDPSSSSSSSSFPSESDSETYPTPKT